MALVTQNVKDRLCWKRKHLSEWRIHLVLQIAQHSTIGSVVVYSSRCWRRGKARLQEEEGSCLHIMNLRRMKSSHFIWELCWRNPVIAYIQLDTIPYCQITSRGWRGRSLFSCSFGKRSMLGRGGEKKEDMNREEHVHYIMQILDLDLSSQQLNALQQEKRSSYNII